MTFGKASILIGQLSDSNLRIWLSVAMRYRAVRLIRLRRRCHNDRS